MNKMRGLMLGLVALSLSWTPGVASGEPMLSGSRIRARFEFVEPAMALAYQNATGQLLDLLAETGGSPPSQLVATTSQGLGYLYLTEVDAEFTVPGEGSYWRNLAAGKDAAGWAAEADESVGEARDLILSHRPQLSLRPATSRVGYDDAEFQFLFIYGVARSQREAFELMSKDYNRLCRETGAQDSVEVYEVIEDGDELRYLVVKQSAGNADFWRSEIELNGRIAGDAFDAIGMRAEGMMSSVETMSTVRLSQGRAPSPFLRTPVAAEQ